jgi:hypothetical protein
MFYPTNCIGQGFFTSKKQVNEIVLVTWIFLDRIDTPNNTEKPVLH